MVNNELSGLVGQIENMIYKEALTNWISSLTRDPKIKDAFVESLIDLGYYDQFIENGLENEEIEEESEDSVLEDTINELKKDIEEASKPKYDVNVVRKKKGRNPKMAITV